VHFLVQNRCLLIEEQTLRSRTEEAESLLSSLELLRLESDRRDNALTAQCSELQSQMGDVERRSRESVEALQTSLDSISAPIQESTVSIGDLKAQHSALSSKLDALYEAVESLTSQTYDLVWFFVQFCSVMPEHSFDHVAGSHHPAPRTCQRNRPQVDSTSRFISRENGFAAVGCAARSIRCQETVESCFESMFASLAFFFFFFSVFPLQVHDFFLVSFDAVVSPSQEMLKATSVPSLGVVPLVSLAKSPSASASLASISVRGSEPAAPHDLAAQF
jgi:hypothetical protein